MNARACMLAAAMAIAAPTHVLAAPPPGATSCLGCHAVEGVDSPVVSLSTLTAAQIETAMQAFRAGTRSSTVMDRIAKGFSDEEVRAIAQWYARAKPE